jgi:major type 1 subunit fimbrin (pilin)
MRNFKMAICAMALASAFTSASSFADTGGNPGQGSVTFNGELLADTCTIDPATVDIDVTLPTLAIQTLPAADAEAGSKGFDIHVTDCPTDIPQVAAHFEAIGSSGEDSSTGNLKNMAPTDDAANPAASEVQVRLYNSDEQQLKLGDTGNPFPIDPTTQEATMRYFGGYYATGATTAGKVYARAIYTLAYP